VVPFVFLSCGVASRVLSVGETVPGGRKPNYQTVRIPFAGKFAAKAADYRRTSKLATKSVTGGLGVNARAAPFSPN
jgi:hypothetical protein